MPAGGGGVARLQDLRDCFAKLKNRSGSLSFDAMLAIMTHPLAKIPPLTAAEQHLLLQATRPATFGTYNSGRQERPVSALPRPRPQRARSRRWRPGRPASAQPPRVHPVPVAPLPRSPNMQFVRSNKLTGRRTVFARSIAQAAAARRAARFAAGAGGQVL